MHILPIFTYFDWWPTSKCLLLRAERTSLRLCHMPHLCMRIRCLLAFKSLNVFNFEPPRQWGNLTKRPSHSGWFQACNSAWSSLLIQFLPMRETLFAEWLIRGTVLPINLSQWAHKIPTWSLPPEALPWPFIMRVLNYRGRHAILGATRKKEEIKYENTRLSFYPVFTSDIQRKRRQFT